MFCLSKTVASEEAVPPGKLIFLFGIPDQNRSKVAASASVNVSIFIRDIKAENRTIGALIRTPIVNEAVIGRLLADSP